jgi:hypothetical protein
MVSDGQVRTGREQGCGTLAFLKVADDSWLSMLQDVIDTVVPPLTRANGRWHLRSCQGRAQAAPLGRHVGRQALIHAQRVIEVGEVDAGAYPLPKDRIGLDMPLWDFIVRGVWLRFIGMESHLGEEMRSTSAGGNTSLLRFLEEEVAQPQLG